VTLTRPSTDRRDIIRRRVPIWGYALAAVALVAGWMVLNGPTGADDAIEGYVTGPCTTSRYRVGGVQCTATLRDGSVVTFSAIGDRPSGSPVLFKRFSRRFVGAYYEVVGH